MTKQNINSKKGFTIIEVVLVLAIAGLIFLMVFVALPALQRSQRDTARRNDMSRVDTSLIQYQTNNQNTTNGDLPKAGKWTGTDKFGTTGIDDEGNEFFAPGCDGNPACEFVQRYMNSGTDSETNTFKDPDGTYYSVEIGNGAFKYDEAGMNHTIYIQAGAECKGEEAIKSESRHFAVLYRLEGAGVYCIDDQ